MADHLTPEDRSINMSRVRATNTFPELEVRRIAHGLGFRFRLHRRDLPGTPDLVFPRYRVAAFVHGCFWHRHEGCRRATMPQTRPEFWSKKFAATIERDARQAAELMSMGWKVVTIWECEVKNAKVVADRLRGALTPH